MQKITFVLLSLIAALPVSVFAQCHHGGGHIHHSSHTHVHVSHSHYTHHYRYHSYSRGRSEGGYFGAAHGAHLNSAQKGGHELSGGTGTASAWQMTDNNVIAATPSFFATYRYFITRGFAVGISGGLQRISGRDTCNCLVPGTQPGKGPLYDFSTNTFTVSADLTWMLYTNRMLQVYQGVAAGVTIYDESDRYPDNTTSSLTGSKFAGQVTLGGVRFGRALGGFAEVGFGYKGLINCGISYQGKLRKSRKLS